MILELELMRRAHDNGLDPYDYSTSFLEAGNVDAYYIDRIGSAQLPVSLDEATYPHLDDTRVAVLGASAGALAAAYLVQRGFPARNMHLIDPMGRRAGIWETPLAEGGINNPKALYFPPDHKLQLGDRSGSRMRDFRRGIVEKHLIEATFIPSMAVDLNRSESDGTWLVGTSQGTTVEADYVVISTGTPRPHNIDGPRIRSNLDTAVHEVPRDQLTVERWQRTLSDEELASGRPVVLLGLGNSTGSMLKQIYDFQDRTGIAVKFYVVTDLPYAAVKNPRQSVGGHQPVFRNVKNGYFTGYSGDLPQDEAAYYDTLYQGKFITDVSQVHFDPASGQLHVKSRQSKVDPIDIPLVFALIGYEREPTLLKSVGAITMRGLLNKKVDGPHIRQMDGAVRTVADGYSSNLFAIGAVAATRDNPSAAVMPKVIATLPGMALTQASREFVKHRAARGRK